MHGLHSLMQFDESLDFVSALFDVSPVVCHVKAG